MEESISRAAGASHGQEMLPSDMAAIITALGHHMAGLFGNDDALAALRASGTTRIHPIDETQRQRLRQATQEVYQGLQGRIGQHWLDRVHAALA